MKGETKGNLKRNKIQQGDKVAFLLHCDERPALENQGFISYSFSL